MRAEGYEKQKNTEADDKVTNSELVDKTQAGIRICVFYIFLQSAKFSLQVKAFSYVMKWNCTVSCCSSPLIFQNNRMNVSYRTTLGANVLSLSFGGCHL